jgi:Homeodomain-like domain/LAGLIDADG-like domain
MHPPEVKAAALELVAQGLNDCEISRRLGVPRRTILDWRRPTYVPKSDRETCPRCWRWTPAIRFTDDDYAEFLAMYLGDGCISEHPRTARLRIALDARYPHIIADGHALLERCFPKNPVDEVAAHGGSCIHLSVYSSHLPCVLPQHGRGRKHDRQIVLEPWQRRIVEKSPWPFLRGFIRTDGCVFVNRTGRYEYLSYDFANKSNDIVALFSSACDLVGVRYRPTQWNGCWHVRINRRESVTLMLEHVGLKE